MFQFTGKDLICFTNDLDLFSEERTDIDYATFHLTSDAYGYYFPGVAIEFILHQERYSRFIPFHQRLLDGKVIDYLLRTKRLFLYSASAPEIEDLSEGRVPALKMESRKGFELSFSKEHQVRNLNTHSKAFHIIADNASFTEEELMAEFYRIIQSVFLKRENSP